MDYAFQDINDIPGALPEGRTKPWGTGQAVLAAKKAIKPPFIVINADDYYGKERFKAVHDYLVNGGNHRTKLVPGALNTFIEFSRKNRDERPLIYFLNGANKKLPTENVYDCFNDYVKNLSYMSSWSGGTAIWKSDFDNLQVDKRINSLFQHINLVFSERNRGRYIINNQRLMEEIPVDVTKKENISCLMLLRLNILIS